MSSDKVLKGLTVKQQGSTLDRLRIYTLQAKLEKMDLMAGMRNTPCRASMRAGVPSGTLSTPCFQPIRLPG